MCSACTLVQPRRKCYHVGSFHSGGVGGRVIKHGSASNMHLLLLLLRAPPCLFRWRFIHSFVFAQSLHFQQQIGCHFHVAHSTYRVSEQTLPGSIKVWRGSLSAPFLFRFLETLFSGCASQCDSHHFLALSRLERGMSWDMLKLNIGFRWQGDCGEFFGQT